MSGTASGYGEDIHDLMDEIPVPADGSITDSSYGHSQMSYSKSMNYSKKTNTRDINRVRFSILLAQFILSLSFTKFKAI